MSSREDDKRTPLQKDRPVPKTKLEFVPLNAQAQATKSKHEPKYRDPNNPFHTWSGYGKRPKWLQLYIAEGFDLEAFRIPDKGPDDG